MPKMGIARLLLFLLIRCYNNASWGFQTPWAQPVDNWRYNVPDGNDGSTQLPFCELQMMTVHQKTVLKKHIKHLLIENHHRHYHKLRRFKRATVGLRAKIWNKLPVQRGKTLSYVVPYTVLSRYARPDFQPVFDSMAAIQNNTCIYFDHIDTPAKKQQYDGEDYLAIVNEPGCHSVIGRHTGQNTLQLELSPKIVDKKTGKWTRKTCMKRRIIVHELFHLLGLYHEHQRSDRENYVTVVLKNVLEKKRDNFKIQADDQNWGFPYNFDSIMNYRQNAFAIDTHQLTIRIKSGNQHCQLGMGMHEHASELDFLLVSLLYNCPGIHQRIDHFIDRHFFTATPQQPKKHHLWHHGKQQHSHGTRRKAEYREEQNQQVQKRRRLDGRAGRGGWRRRR